MNAVGRHNRKVLTRKESVTKITLEREQRRTKLCVIESGRHHGNLRIGENLNRRYGDLQ